MSARRASTPSTRAIWPWPHPSRRYVNGQMIKYMDGNPKRPLPALLELLAREHRIVVDEAYLHDVRDKLDLPKGFDWKDCNNGPVRRKLRSLGCERLLYPEAKIQRGLDLVHTVRPREIAETLLAGRVSSAVIARILEQQGKFQITPYAVEYYGGVVFDVTSMTNVELIAHLNREARLRAYQATDDPFEQKAMIRHARTDPRRFAVTLPGAPASLPSLLLALGLRVSGLDIEKAMAEVEQLAAVRMLGAVLRGSAADVASADTYARLAERAGSIRKELVGPESAMRSVVQRIRLVTDKQPLPLISQLGEHTVGLEPTAHGQENS